jgi:hypothetical protein
MLASRDGRFIPEGYNPRDATIQEAEGTSELVRTRRGENPAPPPKSNP